MKSLLENADLIAKAKALVNNNKAVVAHIHGTFAIVTIFTDLPNTITSQQFSQLLDLTTFDKGIAKDDIDNWKRVIPADIERARAYDKQKIINCLDNWSKFDNGVKRLNIWSYAQWVENQNDWLSDKNDFED